MFSPVKELKLPLVSYSVKEFDNKLIQSLLNIDHGLFGFERLINQTQTLSRFFIPSDQKINHLENYEKYPVFNEKQLKNAHFYSILLKNNDFLPIFLNQNSCIFNDLYLDNPNDSIFIQLLVKQKNNNYQDLMIEQYKSYLSGIDEPSKLKWGRLFQGKILSLLDTISNTNSKNKADEQIENKIDSKGYQCELRLIICSEDPNNTVTYIKTLLKQYSYLNQFIIHEEDKQLLPLMINHDFSNHTFHLSDSEIISLVQNQIRTPILSQEIIPKKEDQKISVYQSVLKALRLTRLITPKQRLNQLDELIGHNMDIITFSIPKGTTFTQFTNKVDDISAAIGKEVNIVKGNQPNSLSFLFPLKQRKLIRLEEMDNTSSFDNYARTHELPICVGLNLFEKPIYKDLIQSPHLLVAGETGSGKSVFLNCILTTWLQVKQTNQLKVKIIDPKQTEFTNYEHYSNVSVITDMQKASQLLDQLIIEMEKRYSILSSHYCKNIQEYNLKYAPLSYIVTMIDEYYDLYLQDNSVEEKIVRLGQKARAAGIHLIVATQRPDKDVMTGTLKVNLPSKISFKLGNNNDYKTVFGRGIPFRGLLGNGDGVMNWVGESEEFIRFQSPFVGEEKGYSQIQPEPDNIDKLKQIITQTGETRVKELQQQMGIRINLVSDLMKQLVDEGFLYKNNKGYQIVDKQE